MDPDYDKVLFEKLLERGWMYNHDVAGSILVTKTIGAITYKLRIFDWSYSIRLSFINSDNEKMIRWFNE